MQTALIRAFSLVLTGDEQLQNVVSVTLQMSISSSLMALLLGVPIGVLLALYPSRKTKLWTILNRTLIGMPPVVCGLLCYMMFSGVGPLRHLKLLYTVQGMVFAQVLLITPVVAGNMESFLRPIVGDIRETAIGLGLSPSVQLVLAINESRYQIISTYLVGFSRAIAEVGAVSMVGGAIANKTNVMTTAIMMYSNRGDFTLSLALGIILLGMSFFINLLVYFLQEKVIL